MLLNADGHYLSVDLYWRQSYANHSIQHTPFRID